MQTSEVSKTNMLVLSTLNFQGATIRPIVPRHKHFIVFVVNHYKFSFALQFLNHIELFSIFLDKSHESQNVKFGKKTNKNPLNTISMVYFLFLVFTRHHTAICWYTEQQPKKSFGNLILL